MMKLRRIVMALLAAAALPGAAAAQGTGTVAGRVVEENTGRALAGAQIDLVGIGRRTVTGQDGRYRLESVPAGPQQVRATRLGYDAETQRITVGAGQNVTADFSLGTSAVAIDALVVNAVTGQSEQVKELGNSVGTINVAEDVNLATITRPAELLQARVAGVQLQSVSGTTGTGQRIRIRGANSLSLSNEPLIIIDGIRYDNSNQNVFDESFFEGGIDQDPSRLNDLSPEDIATMEVLKGPAASGLYGTAAANGVVVITTRQGRAGRPRWNFSVEAGRIEEVSPYPDNILTIGEYPNFLDDDGNPVVDYCPTASTTVDPGDDFYCTQQQTFRFNPLRDSRTTPFRDGSRRKYAMNVSGGGDRATYYLSGDWEHEDGVYANNELEKVNLRTNLRALVNDKLTLTANVGYTSSDASYPDNDNSIISPILNGLLGSAQFDPDNPDLAYFAFSPAFTNQFTPKQDLERFVGSLNANWTPLTWLSGNLTAGVDVTNGFDHQVLQPNLIPLSAEWVSGWVDQSRWNNFNYTFNGAANARFDLTDAVRSTTTLGFDYNQLRFARTQAFGAGITPGTGSLNGATVGFRADEQNSQVITVGGFAQQQFAFRDRIFLTGALRADDNSAFGEDFGLVTYPSANVSWLLSDEDFFPETELVSSFRVRAAYGKSGLRPNFRDAVTFYSPTSIQISGSDQPGITLGGSGNIGLKPERTAEFETGFDAGFLDDKLGLQFTYFNKRSDDALIERELAPSLGLFDSRFENLGRVRNSGVEVSLDARVLDRGPVGLNLRLTGATLRNRIESLGEDVEPIVFNRGAQEHREGFTAGGYFQPLVTFSDANGDGVIGVDEVEVDSESSFIGPSIPTFTGSLSADLSLFDFLRVTTLFDTRRGHYTLNDNEQFRCSFTGPTSGCAGSFDPNAPARAQAAYISSILGDADLESSNFLYVEKADFVKWRELAITLSPPKRWVSRLGRVEGLSLTLAGRNLKTWTDYTGLDPEANESGSSSNFTQGEFGSQAPVRYWTARINFNF